MRDLIIGNVRSGYVSSKEATQMRLALFSRGLPQYVTNMHWRLRLLTRCIAADAQPEDKHKELEPQNNGGEKLVWHRAFLCFCHEQSG